MTDAFKNISDVHRYLADNGYTVSLSTLYNDKVMLPKVGGAIPLSTVRKYIQAKGLRNGTPSEREQDATARMLESKAKDTDEDARKKRLQNEMLETRLAEKRASLFPAEAVERELAVRAQIFRLGLEGWADQVADQTAGLFGADEEVASSILSSLQKGASASELANMIMARRGGFVELFRSSLNRFLDAYATGGWLTDDMARHMQAWQNARDEKKVEIALELISVVRSGEDATSILKQFDIIRKGGN